MVKLTNLDETNLSHILKWLKPIDLYQLSRTCKYLNYVVEFWHVGNDILSFEMGYQFATECDEIHS